MGKQTVKDKYTLYVFFECFIYYCVQTDTYKESSNCARKLLSFEQYQVTR